MKLADKANHSCLQNGLWLNAGSGPRRLPTLGCLILPVESELFYTVTVIMRD